LATKTIDRLPDANGSRAKPKSTSNRTADPQVSLRYLKDEEYAAWDELVRVSPQGSVFSISWWVKAVNARVLGLFKSGRLVAGIPLYYEKRMGMKMCRLPKLTQTFGVVMEPFSGKRVTTTNREMEILTIFAEHLAKERVFSQCFHPSLVNWMPFLWNRFQQTSRFTYVLDDLSDLDAIWDGMEPKLRNVVRKARTLGIELRECNADTVFALSSKTFARQGLANPFGRRRPGQQLRRLPRGHGPAWTGACGMSPGLGPEEDLLPRRRRRSRPAQQRSTTSADLGGHPICIQAFRCV
jgi:hypothetical protein